MTLLRIPAAIVAALALAALAAPPARSADSPCARANGDPVALLAELTEKDKLPEVFRDAAYVALQDKSTWAMWTFTLPGQRAHPAVVCRRPVQEGDVITLDMVVNCKGEANACVLLSQEFKALNAIMAQEMSKGR